MKHALLFLLFYISGSSVFAQEPVLIDPAERYYEEYLTGDGRGYYRRKHYMPLVFSNRAQCGADSEKPTNSAFFLVNAERVGKQAQSILLANNISDKSYIYSSLKAFRIRLSYLSHEIVSKLLAGELPLLPYDLAKVQDLTELKKVVDRCGSENLLGCAEYDKYLAKIWEISLLKKKERVSKLKELDFGLENFSKKFQSQSLFGLQCRYLKKFSPLQSHLYLPTANTKILEEVARVQFHEDKFVTECADPSEKLSSLYYSLQLDVLAENNEVFEQSGFDFWHSFKTYLDWAWRTGILNSSVKFDGKEVELKWLQEVDLASIVMLVPNGCKSIERPSCDTSYLALNSIRKLTEYSHKTPTYNREFGDIHRTDHPRFVPWGPEWDIIENEKPPVNQDILKILKHKDSRSWLQNFVKNIQRTKVEYKNRLWKAVNQLELLQENLSSQEFLLELEKNFNEEKDFRWYNKFFYLCAEYGLARGPVVNQLNDNFKYLPELKSLEKIHPGLENNKLKKYFEYYSNVSEKVFKTCQYLSKKRAFSKKDYKFNPAGFKKWILDYGQEYSYMNEVGPELYDFGIEPLVSYPSSPVTPGTLKAACYDAVDCARMLLESMVYLYSVGTYSDSFFKTRDEISSPHLFNPYAERVACNTYDPWKRKRNSYKLFALDLLNTALFGWNPSPLFFAFDIQDGEVASFDKILEDGKIKLAANMTKDKLRTSVIANFGPLTGTPCVVAIGQVNVPVDSASAYPKFYGFSGITFGAQKYHENRGNYQVDKMSQGLEIGIDEGSRKSFGVTAACTLHFSPVSALEYQQIAEASFSPIKFGVSLLRAFVNFFGSKKHPDVPFQQEFDLDQIRQNFSVNGEISNRCLKRLAKGKNCYKRGCDEDLIDFMEENFPGEITKMQVEKLSNTAFVYLSSCKGFYEVDLNTRTCFRRESYQKSMNRITPHGRCSMPIGAEVN